MYTFKSCKSSLDYKAGSIGTEIPLTLAADFNQSVPYGSRYVVTVTVASVNFDLATIGATTFDIQEGYSVMICNDQSSTGSLVVRNSGLTPIVTLNPGYIANMICDTNLANGWGYSVSSQGVRPTPNMDRYCCRTNELITLNLVTGVIGNTSGADNSGTSSISSVTILKSPSFGTLTSLGPIGSYSYRSNPRFTGVDYIIYSVANSSGTGYKRGTCKIEVQSNMPLTSPAKQFIYVYNRLGVTRIYQYEATGTDTLLVTDTSGQASTVATNNQDNLIYWCILGTIKAYDFVNNVTYTITDARTDPRFASPFQASYVFNVSSYHNGIYYITGSPVGAAGVASIGYFRLAMNTYTYPSTPTISDVTYIQYGVFDSAESPSALTYNPIEHRIYTQHMVFSNVIYRVVDPDSGEVVRETNIPLEQDYQITFAPDGNCYGVVVGAGFIELLSSYPQKSLGSIPLPQQNSLYCLAPAINQPCV